LAVNNVISKDTVTHFITCFFIYPSSVPEIKFQTKLGIRGLQKNKRKQEPLFAPPCCSALFGWSLFWILCAWYDDFF